MFILFRKAAVLLVAVAAVSGLSWPAMDALARPSEHGYTPRARREDVDLAAGFLTFIGLMGGLIGLDVRRRGWAYSYCAGYAAAPGLIAAAFLIPVYEGIGVLPALIGGVLPSGLAATITYFGTGARPTPPG